MMGDLKIDAALIVQQAQVDPGLRPPRKDVPEVSQRPDTEETAKATDAPPPPGEENPAPREGTVKSTEDVLKQLDEQFKEMQAKGYLREVRMKISVDDEGVMNVKILDAATDKVIREIPPESQTEFARHLREAAGVVFDERA